MTADSPTRSPTLGRLATLGVAFGLLVASCMSEPQTEPPAAEVDAPSGDETAGTAGAGEALRSRGEEELRALHAAVLDAHRTGDVEAWMAVESADYVSVNGGRVSHPDSVSRHAARSAYLSSSTFSIYEDVREPIVHVSADGSLGWVIAEVEVRGESSRPGEEPISFHDVYAWIELYERRDGRWKMIGNASNRRDPESTAAAD